MNNLDIILGGGLPCPYGVLVVGEQSSKIALFVRDITWILLNKGFRCLYYAVDESADEIREYFKTIGHDLEPFEKKEALQFSDVFSQGVALMGEKLLNEPNKIVKNVFKLGDMISTGRNFATESKKRGYNDLLVILDSATPLFTAMDRREVFIFGQTLKFSIRYFKAIGITAIHSGVVDQQTEDTARHMADGVIEFSFSDFEKTQLEVKIQKILGATTDRIPVTIEDNSMYFHIPPT